jgi:hypothetical protein
MDTLLAEFSDHARGMLRELTKDTVMEAPLMFYQFLASVNENIKKELLVQIKQFLDANLD